MPTIQKKIYPQILKQIIEKELELYVELEYRFHDKRKWRIDIAVFTSSCKIAIELEGAVFKQGRHSRGVGMVKDMEKYNMMTVYGWKLLRYTHTHHEYYQIINDIKKIM